MSISIISKPTKYKLLIVDDDPDIYKFTEQSLKDLQYQGIGIQYLSATSGKQAIEIMRSNPDVAVILLGVVMEPNSAGLEACRVIRAELKNSFVRILLCTGQAGIAPGKKNIDRYDIDGYLQKSELTSERLYTAVRAAIKIWGELIELERQREYLGTLHDSVIALHSYATLEKNMGHILEAAVTLCPASLAVMRLDTFDKESNPQSRFLHLSTQASATDVKKRTDEIIALNAKEKTSGAAVLCNNGILIPFTLHHQLGGGWLYLDHVEPDALAKKSLILLSLHAANVLYSSAALMILLDREGPLSDTMAI